MVSLLLLWSSIWVVPIYSFTTPTPSHYGWFGTTTSSSSSSSSSSFTSSIFPTATTNTRLAATRPRGKRKSSSSTTKTTTTGDDGGFGAASSSTPLPTTPVVPATTTSNKDEEKDTTTNSSSSSNGRRTIYSLPALYDMAFGYRNFEFEVDFLVGQHQLLHDGQAPTRVLELAAGPARHSIQALQSSMTKFATALDNSHEMVDYGMSIARNELSSTDDKDDNDDDESVESSSSSLMESFSYVQGDMCSFELNEKYDSAWILLGSLQHLTTNDQVISCFESIQKALMPRGTLILELPHPRETFSLVECTRNGWEVPLENEKGEEYGELAIVWGDDDDEFDPIRQVRQFTVSMDLTMNDDDDSVNNGNGSGNAPNGNMGENSELQSVREVIPLRLFTAQEIDALGRIAGFRVMSMHGALADDVSVNDEEEAFRLVCVLQKQ
jgi:SAM-dependent methyltransferase